MRDYAPALVLANVVVILLAAEHLSVVTGVIVALSVATIALVVVRRLRGDG